jgi:hypothetical protein
VRWSAILLRGAGSLVAEYQPKSESDPYRDLGSMRKAIQRDLFSVTCGEPVHHAGVSPQLDVMTVDQLLGGLAGGGIILAIQIDRFDDAVFAVEDVGSVMRHVTRSPVRQSMQQSQSPAAA